MPGTERWSHTFTRTSRQLEWPNPFSPSGREHDLRSMLEAARRGAQVVRDQRYEIRNLFAKEENVLAELDWSATPAVDTPKYPAGHTLRAHVAMVFRLEGGRIRHITNYDCYEP